MALEQSVKNDSSAPLAVGAGLTVPALEVFAPLGFVGGVKSHTTLHQCGDHRGRIWQQEEGKAGAGSTWLGHSAEAASIVAGPGF